MEIKFPDGLIYQDPRREDMLFYYVPQGDWKRAIGMQLDYDPRAAHPATFRFWKESFTRLQSMNDADLALMIQRYAQTISKEGGGGRKAFTIELPDWFIARVGESGILQAFVDAGWRLQSKEMNSFHWVQVPPTDAA